MGLSTLMGDQKAKGSGQLFDNKPLIMDYAGETGKHKSHRLGHSITGGLASAVPTLCTPWHVSVECPYQEPDTGTWDNRSQEVLQEGSSAGWIRPNERSGELEQGV